MTTTPEYDAILARKLAERAKEPKIEITCKYEGSFKDDILKIENGKPMLYSGNTGECLGEAIPIQPKRRGRPKGSRNRPKGDKK